MLAVADLLAIAGVAVASSLAVGACGLAVLVLARRASILVRVCTVVVTAMGSAALGMLAIMRAMYVSEHDFTVFLAIAAASTVTSIGVAIVLGRVVSHEGRRLRDLARALGDGVALAPDTAVRARRSGGSDELSAVAHELVEASARLERARAEVAALDASRRDLVAWISHDLRTPLAGLRAMAEALEDGLVDDPDRFHRQIRAQADRLSGMVDDLFELSKIHSGALRSARDEVGLYDLVSDAVADLRPVADAKCVALRATGGAGVVVVGDARELTRVVENLLTNAIEHSPPGSEVVVSIDHGDAGEASLSVVDAGGGIPEADLDRVFIAGWRGSSARTHDAAVRGGGHAGLGLAIVHGIVHAGAVSVRNVPGGCRFDVRLPVATSEAPPRPGAEPVGTGPRGGGPSAESR